MSWLFQRPSRDSRIATDGTLQMPSTREDSYIRWPPATLSYFFLYLIFMLPITWGIFALAKLIGIPWYVTGVAIFIAAGRVLADIVVESANDNTDLLRGLLTVLRKTIEERLLRVHD
jgi:hypothetical protein